MQPLLGGVLGHAAVSSIVAGVSTFPILCTAWRWRKAGLAADRRTFDLMVAAVIVVSLVTGFQAQNIVDPAVRLAAIPNNGK